MSFWTSGILIKSELNNFARITLAVFLKGIVTGPIEILIIKLINKTANNTSRLM
jgi:hypothetical protein